MSLHVGVFGAGNWGTTLAQLAALKGHRVTLWTRSPERSDEINQRRTNHSALPGIQLCAGVSASVDHHEALSGVDLVVLAIPAQSFRATLHRIRDALQPQHAVVHGTKGLEQTTLRRMSELVLEETCIRQVGALAGPNIAPEVARGLPAGTVVASAFPRLVRLSREFFASELLMVFESADLKGVELCSAFKNVVAIAAGMADELNMGDNTKALLITRGIAELMRLTLELGAEPTTVAGLAGLGDLMVTCSSKHSRNRRIGAALARGERWSDAQARIGMVAEGIYAAQVAGELARRHRLKLPLFETVDRVLHEGLSTQEAIRHLMHLPVGHDISTALSARTATGGRPNRLSSAKGGTP
jgi:glycerol-3-phosphate dehydrogenase (NAD(P)+)